MNKQPKIQINETKNFVDKRNLTYGKEDLHLKLKYGMEEWQL